VISLFNYAIEVGSAPQRAPIDPFIYWEGNMKAFAAIASIAIITAFATPSLAQKGSQTVVSGKQCYRLAVSRGWRPSGKRGGYRKFMRQCKAGKIPL
jgi:hypothetical protein